MIPQKVIKMKKQSRQNIKRVENEIKEHKILKELARYITNNESSVTEEEAILMAQENIRLARKDIQMAKMLCLMDLEANYWN